METGDYMKAGLYYEQAIREHGFSQAAYVVSTYVGYGRALIAQKKYKSALEKLRSGKRSLKKISLHCSGGKSTCCFQPVTIG